MIQQFYQTFLSRSRDKARLGSLQLQHTGDWLNVVLSMALGLHMKPQEFFLSFLYRLGAKVFQEEGPCTACGRDSDVYGDHAISCGNEGERIARHNHLRDALFHTAVAAALGSVKEERAVIPGSNARPADLLIPNWSGGKDAVMDVTVNNPLQLSLLERSADSPGHSLNVAFNRKWTKYGEACLQEGVKFIPLPCETFGAWHEAALCEIKKLGCALARHLGQDESETVKHLFESLSILLMKGNIALLINRIPSHPSSHINGDPF